jgi:hypothetical protein
MLCPFGSASAVGQDRPAHVTRPRSTGSAAAKSREGWRRKASGEALVEIQREGARHGRLRFEGAGGGLSARAMSGRGGSDRAKRDW